MTMRRLKRLLSRIFSSLIARRSQLTTRNSQLATYRGALGAVFLVSCILALSVGLNPQISISTPARVVPFAGAPLNKNALLFDLRRVGFDILEQMMGPSFDSPDMRDFIEQGIIGAGTCPFTAGSCNGVTGVLTGGPCSGTGCCLVAAPEWACACDIEGDGHFMYYDTTATTPYAKAIINDNACGNPAGCPPTFVLTPFANNSHNGSHPNEPHLDALITLYDVVFQVRTRALCIDCNAETGLATFPLTLVINPNKVDVNNVSSRTDDPVITIDIPVVEVAPQGDISACGLTLPWGCVGPLVEPMLEDTLGSTLQAQFLGTLPMDMNAMFASEPAYACPNYAGTAKNPWCTNGVQTDPNQSGFGYCKDLDGDGMIETNLPAYNAGIGQSPPTTYGTMSCGDSLANLGVYPHLIINNADGVRSADDRLTMNSDFGCETQEAAGDIDPSRINVQPKLCSPTAAGCNGSTCTTATCSPYPGCCAAASYPRCCTLAQPTNPNGFACAVGQDMGNQLTSGIAQSGLISCEVNQNGLETGFPLPLPLPIDMNSFLEVESFGKIIPPIDDYADPGSHVTIRWRPYGDGNPATKEICAAIGGPPGPVYQAQGCTALVNTGPVDINYSFRNIYTDFYIEQGGALKRAFGVAADLGGAVDIEFRNFGPPQDFSTKAAFLSSGCNPLAAGAGVDCLKFALDPLDILNVQFRYQELEPDYVLNMAELADSFPDTLINLIGGAAQLWLETQFTLAGLGFDMISAGPDAGGWPDLDGNGYADYLTCSGNFAGSFDLIKLLDALTGGGGSEDPCAVDNPKAPARTILARLAPRNPQRATSNEQRVTPAGGPETFIVHPLTGQSESRIRFSALQSKEAAIYPRTSVIRFDAVGSGFVSYTYRLDRGVWRVSQEPSIKLPYLLEGTHLLEVQALDSTGIVDPSPATFIFQIDSVGPVVKVEGVNRRGIAEGDAITIQLHDYQFPLDALQAAYRLDGAEWVSIKNPETVMDISTFKNGSEHRLDIRGEDPAFNPVKQENNPVGETGYSLTFRIQRDSTPERSGSGGAFGCSSLPFTE